MQGLELFSTGHEIRVQTDESGEPAVIRSARPGGAGHRGNVTQLRARLSDDLCLTYPMRIRLGRTQRVG